MNLFRLVRLFLSTFLVFSFCLVALAAEDWYVCLASYRDEKSAMKQLNSLESHGCPAFAGKVQTESGELIRVFYSRKFKSQSSAIQFKNKLESSPQLDFLPQKNFWCVPYAGEMFRANPDYEKSLGERESAAEVPFTRRTPEIPVEKVVEIERKTEVVNEIPVVVIEEVPVEKNV